MKGCGLLLGGRGRDYADEGVSGPPVNGCGSVGAVTQLKGRGRAGGSEAAVGGRDTVWEIGRA